MNKWEKSIGCLICPSKVIVKLAGHGYLPFINDETYLKMRFKQTLGYPLDLNNPKTFNEKLQWLKLHDRNPEYTIMVDKVAVKQWVADRIGEEHIIPTLGVWDDPDEIDFNALPNQFVLKCNHNSGLGMYICTDKSKLDIQRVKRELRRGLKQNYYLTGREWPYKNVPRKILAEKYMADGAGEYDQITDDSKNLTDYKFFCFNGIPRIVYISRDHDKDPRTDFFDMDFNSLPIRMRDPSSNIKPVKPADFEQMKRLAGILSEGVPHLRVDFYSVDGDIYVGELTFYHCSGLAPITPPEWNYKLGSWIELSGAGGYYRTEIIIWLCVPRTYRARQTSEYAFNGSFAYVWRLRWYPINGNA